MLQYIIVFIAFFTLLSFMLVVLNWVQWKKRTTSCCGGGHCDTAPETLAEISQAKTTVKIINLKHDEHDHEDCSVCPDRGTPSCTCDI